MTNEEFDRRMFDACRVLGYIYCGRELQNDRLEIIIEVKPNAVTGAKVDTETLTDRLNEDMPFPYYPKVIVL